LTVRYAARAILRRSYAPKFAWRLVAMGVKALKAWTVEKN